MQEIAAVDANLKCIPNKMEKYISFSLGKLRFIDSFQFLLSSVDSLVASNKPEVFEIIKQLETDSAKRSLILRKGVYPYEYMDSFERFNETSLPPKEAFYSNFPRQTSQTKTMNTPRKSGKPLNAKTLDTTTISIFSQTRFSSQTCLKTSA